MYYERGLEQLKQLLQGTAWEQEFQVYEARLRENLRREQLYGANEQHRADRAQIIDQLNRLARQVGTNFNDLCLNLQNFPSQSTKPVKIFVSYAKQDQNYLNALAMHLQRLKKSGLIQTWSDQDILAGSNWRNEVDYHLINADIILLLISPAFMASEYLYEVEVAYAMKRHMQGEARVIPIILRPTPWVDAPFGQLQALPRDRKTITERNNPNQAFDEIAKEIRRIIEQLQASRAVKVDWATQGNELLELGQYDKALDAYEQALRIDPANELAHIGKGNALLSLNKHLEALDAYEEAIRLNPANATAYILRGDVLRGDLNRFSEALASYKQALRQAPNNPLAHLGKGQALFNLQRFDEALDAYNHVIQLEPDNVRAYIGRGEIFAKQGRYNEALTAYNRAIQLAPEIIEAHFLRAQVLLHLTSYEQAREAFEQIIKLKPDDIAAHLGMGEALRQMHHDEEALEAYDAVTLLDPSNAIAYREKASILYALERSDEAQLALQQAGDQGVIITDEFHPTAVGEEITETQLSQTRIDSVRQFLTNAGFMLQTFPDEARFIAWMKKPIWKSWFHKGLYIQVLFDNRLDQRRVEAIAQDARRHKCDYALVIINRQPVTSGWAQINILRAEQGARRFVCLPIDEALIQKGIASKREHATLRYYLDHRLGGSFDPYDVDSPVSGVVSFFGRQRITEELMEDLRHGRRAGLFGIQKMGKSSVLKELQLHATFPVAYVYLTVGESLGRIYKRILEEWATSGRVKYANFTWTAPQFFKEEVSQSEFDAAAKSLLSYLETLDGVVPLLAIFLDEIEHIVPTEDDEKTLELYIHLMDSLRGLHQETQSLSLLVAGVHPGIARDNYFWGTQKNPMHQVIKEYFLPPLDRDDCANMIRSLGEQINIQYEESALEYILEMSGSHPLLARRICSYARQKHTTTGPITVDTITEVLREFVRDPQKNAYLGEHGLWMELGQPHLWSAEVSKANQQILLKLASDDQGISKDELCADLDQAIATQAFHILKERSIISSPDNSDYYQITFGLFKSWIHFRHLGTL
jgi:tetratricopeptide (TPR) repeat protein